MIVKRFLLDKARRRKIKSHYNELNIKNKQYSLNDCTRAAVIVVRRRRRRLLNNFAKRTKL